MDDLRRRFSALDTVAVPDIWPEIERRHGSQAAVRTERVRTRPAARPALSPAFIVLIVGLLLAALVTGLVVGSWINQVVPPAPTATSSPTALTLDCAVVQRSAESQTTSWQSGPGPEAPGQGWIAAWATETTPELVLVDPVSGDTCPLVAFPDYPAPPYAPQPGAGPRDWIPVRGALSWSPDGRALAFVVIRDATETAPRTYALFVWSGLGLAGPLIQAEEPARLYVPSWSPDGTLLAIGGAVGSFESASERASVWIFTADGSIPRQLPADCGACVGGSAYWSPSGDRLAIRTWGLEGDGAGTGFAAGSVDSAVLPLIDGTSDIDSLLGWANEDAVFMLDTLHHVVQVPISQPAERVDFGAMPLDLRPSDLVLSPDGTKAAQIIDQQPRGPVHLSTTTFPASRGQTLVANVTGGGFAWWSPDGQTFGYLVDRQVGSQGIWLINADGTEHRQLVSGALVLTRDTYEYDATLIRPWQPRP